jgi:enamine deaminase RidA (YjgF/YER057c/UK114 family)
MEKQLISSGSRWEPLVGYSRAVRMGNHVYVSGTTGTDASGQSAGDAYAQAKQALMNIGAALEQAGAKFSHVIRTRIFVTDIAQWEEVGRAHGEVFGDIRPVTTMVEVSRLIAPDLHVEIEAEAIIS